METHRRGAEGPVEVEANRCAAGCGDREDRRAGRSDGRRRSGPKDERGRRGAMSWNTAREGRNEGEVRSQKSRLGTSSDSGHILLTSFQSRLGCPGVALREVKIQSPRRIAWRACAWLHGGMARREATTADALACPVSHLDLKKIYCSRYCSLLPLAHRSRWRSTRIYVRPR